MLKNKQGSKPISTQGSYGGKKKVANWMRGLTPNQIQEILGGPITDSSGVTRHSKKKPIKKKKKKVKIASASREGDDLVRRNYD